MTISKGRDGVGEGTRSRPIPGLTVWWRFSGGKSWRFGYVTWESGELIRLGRWHGDRTGGVVVDPSDIEWRLR